MGYLAHRILGNPWYEPGQCQPAEEEEDSRFEKESELDRLGKRGRGG
jgi:hypothetical protein